MQNNHHEINQCYKCDKQIEITHPKQIPVCEECSQKISVILNEKIVRPAFYIRWYRATRYYMHALFKQYYVIERMYVCDSLENPGTKEYVNSEYYSFNHRDFVGALEWAQCGRFFIVLPIYKKYLKQNTDPNIQYSLRPVEPKKIIR